MATVFCDEAGNTGANLLDGTQPFFVLASNNFAAEEAEQLLDHVQLPRGSEPKFTTLRKSVPGVAKLIRFLSDPRLSCERVVADVFDKRFMVVTKLVDLVVETLIHKIGGDLYKDGANIAMSNMLHHCMPAFCGQENTDRFLLSFVDLVRKRGPEHVAAYYEAGRAMLEACDNEPFRKNLFFFTDQSLFTSWFGDEIDSQALDPAIPALFGHIAVWGARISDRFDVIHDDSKPIIATQSTFESMMASSGEESRFIGYDRRKFRFPLRAKSLSQANSKMHPQIQVADLCAGIINHFSKCRMANDFDELATATRELGRTKWVFDNVLPTTDVTPQTLGTAEAGGNNPIDAIVDHLSR
ncbi:hypothetical protein CPBF426_10630 [Xanthomonas arboricola pv. juglandis]|uniref:DUF3800 domain-containing protein n=1 Tax=Xanthomonas TaxID=338 RepID=UPI000E5A3D90|nr:MULTISPECIES: DUF3800 domain-containing protein [Xanthomonas]CAD1796075.1 DUF3800 domain-containing protein [Xanthomonas sp. CPBF 426]CAG2095652.1 DUF3800 domain-containing protein [Xanthomonas euroxanthea]SYZ51449.1 hypothetical protein CPBF426_10630 [Xanthomonas arboricola pv. juglandis]